jgi:RimJ/RimL family protein N-acetyltransferase
MDTPFVDGNRLYLRNLKKEDLTDRYLSWLNNRETVEFMESGRFPVSMAELEKFHTKITESENDVIFAIVDKSTGAHIGNIKIGNINRVHSYADLGILIGEKEFRGKGYGSEAINLVLEYAFNRLNLNKVILGTYADHTSAIKLYEKAGFKKEGTIRNLLFRDGKYHDKILMGILSEEFHNRRR